MLRAYDFLEISQLINNDFKYDDDWNEKVIKVRRRYTVSMFLLWLPYGVINYNNIIIAKLGRKSLNCKSSYVVLFHLLGELFLDLFGAFLAGTHRLRNCFSLESCLAYACNTTSTGGYIDARLFKLFQSPTFSDCGKNEFTKAFGAILV